MPEKNFLRLQHSEAVVAQMASRLLAAYIGIGKMNESNEEEMIEKSVSLALRLAQKTDKLVESDDEERD